MRTLTESAQVAAIIRKHLKAEGIQATVRSSNFSMGDSVTVHLLDDPNPATVQQVREFCAKFKDGHFNGMEDIYEYTNHADKSIPRTKYLHVECRYSDTIRANAADYTRTLGCDPDGWDGADLVWQALNGSLGNFWNNREQSPA